MEPRLAILTNPSSVENQYIPKFNLLFAFP